MMTPVQRSFFFSAVERYASLLLFLGATAVLARLLTPEEFGIYAVTGAITAVITAAFQEFGGANYLIQRQDLSAHGVRTAFTVTFVLSAAVCALLCLLAEPLAAFFGQQELRPAIAVSSLNLLIAPFSGTAAALFRRKLDFRTLAVCALISNALGSIVAIALALHGWSFMAPIWGGIAGNLLQTALLLARRQEMMSFRPCFVDFRDVIGFGLYSSGVSVINVVYGMAPQLLLARILDFSSVGLYSRAVSITQVFEKLITQVLNPVIMPAIAARKTAGDDLKRIFLESVELLSAAQWPALLFVALMARPIILIWLGPTWLEIVPLVRLLCVANMALFAACLSYPVLVAAGGVRDSLISSLVSVPPSLLIIFCAAFFGVQAVAASALLTLPLQAAIAFYYIGRRLFLEPRDFFGPLAKSALVAAMTAAGAAICIVVANACAAGPILELAAACVVAAIFWLIALALTSHPLLSQLRQSASGLGAHALWLLPKRSPT